MYCMYEFMNDTCMNQMMLQGFQKTNILLCSLFLPHVCTYCECMYVYLRAYLRIFSHEYSMYYIYKQRTVGSMYIRFKPDLSFLVSKIVSWSETFWSQPMQQYSSGCFWTRYGIYRKWCSMYVWCMYACICLWYVIRLTIFCTYVYEWMYVCIYRRYRSLN